MSRERNLGNGWRRCKSHGQFGWEFRSEQSLQQKGTLSRLLLNLRCRFRQSQPGQNLKLQTRQPCRLKTGKWLRQDHSSQLDQRFGSEVQNWRFENRHHPLSSKMVLEPVHSSFWSLHSRISLWRWNVVRWRLCWISQWLLELSFLLPNQRYHLQLQGYDKHS